MWEKGITIATELAQQKSEFIFGAFLLFLSFLVQVVGKFLPPDVAASIISSSSLYGAALGFVGPTILLLLLYIPFRRHRSRSVRDLIESVEVKA
jgi:hypothetical protein